MAKDKISPPVDPALQAPLVAMRLYEREIAKTLEKSGTALTRGDAQHLAGIESYAILLFLTEFAAAEMSEKQYKALLAKYGVDTPGHLRNFPMLSQTVVFEVFQRLNVSRESIRRLLLMMAKHDLIERVSKGPPFPDRLAASKTGRKLMGRVGKRLAKEMQKGKAFGYL